jgi:HAMP domain-containing protein
MGLRAKFNIAFILIFAVGLTVTSVASYFTELQQAREEVVHEAEVLLSMALATRSYTVGEVRPLLWQLGEQDDFLEQTVPSYAAQATFLTFNQEFSEFTYREAALNPTSPRDLAQSWEVDIIQGMIAADDDQPAIGERQALDERFLYLARPIRITNESCLECHSTPDRAPASMIAEYGADGGFGWEMNEIVGAQIVSVPMSVAYEKAEASTLTLVGSLFAVFTLILTAVNIMLDRMFIRPLRQLAIATDRYSRGDIELKELPAERHDEIGQIERATNRMRRSLKKAIEIAQLRERGM